MRRRRRACRSDVAATMKLTYISHGGSGPAYEIEVDRHGSYTIRQDGKVVKRVTSLRQYLGRPRWGSRELELAAIEEAKAVIEAQDAHEP
jgi:hypothetical protein